MFNDYDKKKDFMVEWENEKGEIKKTKVKNKFTCAMEAADYIRETRATCKKVLGAYWI